MIAGMTGFEPVSSWLTAKRTSCFRLCYTPMIKRFVWDLNPSHVIDSHAASPDALRSKNTSLNFQSVQCLRVELSWPATDDLQSSPEPYGTTTADSGFIFFSPRVDLEVDSRSKVLPIILASIRLLFIFELVIHDLSRKYTTMRNYLHNFVS